MSLSQDLRKIADEYAPQAVLPFTYDEIITIARAKLGLRREQAEAALSGLYEAKLISYPRTDVPHLPLELRPALPSIMFALDVRFGTNNPSCHADVWADEHSISAVWKSTESFDLHYGIIPTAGFDCEFYDTMPEDFRAIFNLIVQRFAAVFSYKPRVISNDAREKLLAAADLIDQVQADVSDENKGLWRFWNRKASELASKLAEKERQ